MKGNTLLLSRRTVARLATTADYFESMRAAFAGLAAQRFELPSVGHIPANGGAFHIKSAIRTGARPLVAIKVNGNFPGNAIHHGLPTIQGFIALLDAECGSVLALMDSMEITARRTAATTALAAKYLARPDSRTLGLVGCGTQARCHLAALLDVFPIERVRFYDLRDEAAESFARHQWKQNIQLSRVCDAPSCARGADIVVTTTTSTQPVLALADVAPGTFVAGIGADNSSKHELAPDLLRASRVVVDLLAQSSTMGDLHHAIRSGAMCSTDIHGELADLIGGTIAGRTCSSERFVFDSTGIALQDLAAAEMIYERAQAQADIQHWTNTDIGFELPTRPAGAS